jgi:hypothetical protein
MIPVDVSYLILFAILALILVIAFDDDDPRFP